MKVGYGQYECGNNDLITELHQGYNPKNIYTLMFIKRYENKLLYNKRHQ
jgi:hypothetical protein